MTYRIEIKLLALPPAGKTFGFKVAVNGVVLLDVAKSFGTVAGENVIVPGTTAAAAVTAVLANLQTYEAVAGVVYSKFGTSVYADIDTAGYITVGGLNGSVDYVSVYGQDPEIMSTAPVNTYKFTIEVIDTYTNERDLIEEFTQPSACKLNYDGGEDLYQPMMPSNFAFNMAAIGFPDAKFLHLLTGDEKRYLVKIKNTDTHDVVTLMWQGYILPDLYSEPWKNGVPFIAFSAIDMLASLKIKTFKPWYYQQAYNLPELFGIILAETGLVQEMFITPSLVCISKPDYRWRDTYVSLAQFDDGKKQDNLYEILETVLQAQGLQLYSFRGKWYFKGLTRRADNMLLARRRAVVEVYHPDGIFKDNIILDHEIIATDYSNGTVNITAETPWKKVNLEFDTDSKENLLPEEIFFKKYMYADFINDPMLGNPDRFANNLLDMWKWVGPPYMHNEPMDFYGVGHEFKYTPNGDYYWDGTDNYYVTEAMALNAYFECRVKPFVLKDRVYELEIEFKVGFSFDGGDFATKLKNGDFDKYVPFQLLHDGQELISNRPGFEAVGQYTYDKEESTLSNSLPAGIFKLKREFSVPNDGVLTFRILSGIGELPWNGMSLFRFDGPSVLRINVVEDLGEAESVSAVRNVQYTKELDLPIGITCTIDSSVKESFGIGKRLLARFFRINTDAFYQFAVVQWFLPNTRLYVDLRRWPIPKWVQDYVFVNDRTGSLFLERPSGEIIPYNSLYTTNIDGVPYMAVYIGYSVSTGNPSARPTLPAGYKALPGVLPADKLMLMMSGFEAEDSTQRALWKISGFPDSSATSYLKTLAKACHAVRPDVCFSMDATALAIVWPGQLSAFAYNGENRYFVPVRLSIDLSEGKTDVTQKEYKLENLTDITYE